MTNVTLSKEFFDSAEQNFASKRFNAATDSYFKALVSLCDYELRSKQGILPKNHQERFTLLEINYPFVYSIVSDLFITYTKTNT